MLTDVLDVLKQVGLVVGRRDQVSANAYWSHHLSFSVSSGVDRYFAKIAPAAEDTPLKNEARALSAVYPVLEGNVPEHLSSVDYKNFNFLILSFVDSNRRVTFFDMVRNEIRVGEWERFFRALGEVGLKKISCPFTAQLAFFDREIPILADYIKSHAIAKMLQTLESTNQHGDLVTNNIGYKRDRPIVYDWEDYGKVTVVGFDLAIFVGSLLNYQTDRILAMVDSHDEDNAVIKRLIEANKLKLEDFRRLLPVYYGLFYQLKKTNGYGRQITTLAFDAANQMVSRIAG